MPIGNLMTPPRCSARAAATVIRRQRNAVVDGGTPPGTVDTYQPPGWIASGADRTNILSDLSDRRPPQSLISANAYIDHYATIYIDHYATIRHRQDQVPRTLLLHMC